MRYLLVTTVAVFATLLFACGPDTGPSAAPETKMTNSELKTRIETRLNSDMQVQAAKLDVDADADRNMAKLSGTVESEMLRTRAVDLAKAAHPGMTIQDEIKVKPRELTREEYTEEHARVERDRATASKETVGDSIDDAWIHSKLVAKFIADSDTPERKINIDVKSNVVTLRGTVDTAEAKTEAERIAKETDGVKRVVNQLKVAAR